MESVDTISELFLSHIESPRNSGPLESANASAVGVGSCGDTMTVQLLVEEDIISEIGCIPKGCMYTIACASLMSELVKGKSLEAALTLQPEHLDLLLGGLPEDHQHCARLAVNSLGEAIDDYYQKNGFPQDSE